jgi:5-methylcytosine-specific restriction endonuclease McrBC GTP-binding regulatory subunit McrB
LIIIDEINRGNIAKIFGELMYLLEYRAGDNLLKLAYSKNEFSIPDNVYIIGTMNTADRSIAIVDYALRRRFYHIYLKPERNILKNWLKDHIIDSDLQIWTLRLFDKLDDEIDDMNFKIGHSYFMSESLTMTELEEIWKYSIEPLLEVYWFDNPERMEKLRWDELIKETW